jgi:hypothetical protein
MFELLEAMWRTRSTPEKDTHVGQPCGESFVSRELVHLPQPPSQTLERAPASPYPSTTDPTRTMVTQASDESTYSSTTTPTSAMWTQTSDESPLNNDAKNMGKRNKVSQKGRRNRNWNMGDENRVNQDSREYEQTVILASIVLVVSIIGWAFFKHSPTK